MEERTRGELTRDLVAALALICLALAYGWQAQQIPGSSLIGKGIGAGAVPTGLAVALGFFSLVLVLRSTLGLRRVRRRRRRPLAVDRFTADPRSRRVSAPPKKGGLVCP